MVKEFPVGTIAHFFRRIGVAVVELEKPLLEGDEVRIEGATTNLEQSVRSMEIDHDKVRTAWPGERVALKVKGRVRPGDRIFVRDTVEEEEDFYEAPARARKPTPVETAPALTAQGG